MTDTLEIARLDQLVSKPLWRAPEDTSTPRSKQNERRLDQKDNTSEVDELKAILAHHESMSDAAREMTIALVQRIWAGQSPTP